MNFCNKDRITELSYTHVYQLSLAAFSLLTANTQHTDMQKRCLLNPSKTTIVHSGQSSGKEKEASL